MARPYCDQNSPNSLYQKICTGFREYCRMGWRLAVYWDDYNCGLERQLSYLYFRKNTDMLAWFRYRRWRIFRDGFKDKDLFIRWAQFGALVPIMENGGKYNNTTSTMEI